MPAIPFIAGIFRRTLNPRRHGESHNVGTGHREFPKLPMVHPYVSMKAFDE